MQPGLRNALPGTTQDVLTAAADANFVVHCTWAARRLAGATVWEDAALVLVDSGLPCDTFNLVCRARLDDHEAQGRVARAISRFRTAVRRVSRRRPAGGARGCRRVSANRFSAVRRHYRVQAGGVRGGVTLKGNAVN